MITCCGVYLIFFKDICVCPWPDDVYILFSQLWLMVLIQMLKNNPDHEYVIRTALLQPNSLFSHHSHHSFSILITQGKLCILEAQRKTRVLKKMSLFQGWQLNSRNVISNLSCTNILICVQLTGQVCPWLKGKENGSKIPLQEGGGGWKYLWRATRHETAWEHPI